MNKFSGLIIILLTSLIVFADTDNLIRECPMSCSSRCIGHSKAIKRQAENVVHGCRLSDDKSSALQACANSFGRDSNGLECSKRASSAETHMKPLVSLHQ